MISKKYHWPDFLFHEWRENRKNCPLSDKELAFEIKNLSDHFIHVETKKTNWNAEKTKWAYQLYFHPLNTLRCLHVLEQNRNILQNINVNSIIDWGCGYGAFSKALCYLNIFDKPINLFDVDHSIAIDAETSIKKLGWKHCRSILSTKELKSDTAVFCYSLNEIKNIDLSSHFSNFIFIEPSTKKEGRQLLNLRKQLIQNGYFAWSPCLHSDNCPLLEQSQNDWCHMSMNCEHPDEFTQIESYLPMLNKTLTYSYLILSKTKPEMKKEALLIVGDVLKEKGKSKVMICRNSTREFLSLLKRQKIPLNTYRGEVYKSPKHTKKGNELRSEEPLILFDDSE